MRIYFLILLLRHSLLFLDSSPVVKSVLAHGLGICLPILFLFPQLLLFFFLADFLCRHLARVLKRFLSRRLLAIHWEEKQPPILWVGLSDLRLSLQHLL